ncbi:hypothetical protein [Streptosporangium sp. OZ121]|uniref:hypothetical protein n=1 Tax=Streptosporangium sp. OZ121 TaxID=3444183 RepID=UPI003F798C04
MILSLASSSGTDSPRSRAAEAAEKAPFARAGVWSRVFSVERRAGHETPGRMLVVDALLGNRSGKVSTREPRGHFEAAATGRTEGA